MREKPDMIRLAAMCLLLAAGSWYMKPVEESSLVTPLRFEDVSASSGCTNVHSKVALSPQFDNIMPWLSSVGAAVCAGDFDGDGRVDFYATNSGRNSLNRLFRNMGNGTFNDEAARAGVADCNREGASMDAMFFDYDNDGDQDLFVVKWGATDILFQNQGDGTFRDVTAAAGVGFWGYANGVISLDFDRDGWPDIFVANYFADSVVNPATGRPARNDLWNPVSSRIMHTTFTHAVNGGRNVLYRNNGDGTFSDVTVQSGLGHTGWSLDAGSGDLNNDGWPDLYVSNDFGADELYYSTGASEQPPRFRLVIDPEGHPGIGNDWWKGMNVDIGDVDGNGRLDIYVTNILARRYKTDEGNMLWLNAADPTRVGGCRFVNAGAASGTNDGGWGWGAKICDFNNDGLMDIVAANGFATGADPGKTYWFQLQEMVTQTKNNSSDVRDWPVMGDRDLSGYEPTRLFIQLPPAGDPAGSGGTLHVPRFADMAAQSGITDLYNGRGIALADIDDDGDIDMYVANQGAPNCLYRNGLIPGGGTPEGRHWIGLSLIGDPQHPWRVGGRTLATTADAVGARVEVRASGKLALRELTPWNGFASQSDRRIQIGLGNAGAADSLIVRWPSGRVSSFGRGDIRVDSYRTIREPAGSPVFASGGP